MNTPNNAKWAKNNEIQEKNSPMYSLFFSLTVEENVFDRKNIKMLHKHKQIVNVIFRLHGRKLTATVGYCCSTTARASVIVVGL